MDKVKNQKGVAFIPILIWIIVISGTVFIAQDAVKQGYITIDSPYIVKETPTPQPTTFPTPLPTHEPGSEPTPKLPQGQVKGVTQTNQNAQESGKAQAITHDGSRTGPIVDYFELCTGKNIKVYENERVPYKRITGETVYSTKGDIKCYEDQINQLKWQANQPTTQSTNTYTTPYYTPYSPPRYYSCTICYSTLGTCSTYNYMYRTKEECDAEQQRINQQVQDSSDRLNEIVNRTYKPQYTTPTFPVPTPLKIEPSCTKYYDPFGGPVREECR